MNTNLNKTMLKNNRVIKSLNEPVYGSFHARAIAVLIDCLLVGIVFMPFFALVDNIIFGKVWPGEILNLVAEQATLAAQENPEIDVRKFILNSPEIKDYFITNHGLLKVFLDQTMQLITLLLTFLCFWIKKQATPGKMLLSLIIVDATTLEKPTPKQLLIRMFGYIVSGLCLFLGVIWIAFDPRKQAWHDKMANTLVIKKPKGIKLK